jgi:uncharacterized protein (TIGR00299 family) protein
MALGAFVDLGVDPDELRKELGKLGLAGWKLEFARDSRNGIGGIHASVILDEEDGNHGPHGHHGHEHNHEHHEHEHHDHGEHAHNSWKEIRALIEKAALRDGAKTRALDIFSRIAVAESKVHGVPVEDVAFHEVGAMDSIIDIVGAAICLDILGPEKITAGEIELGGGTVKCAHGILPVPAPATELLMQGLPVRTGGFNKEMTTPTGAAILASCVDEFITGPASFKEIKTGVGIGNRKLDKPNVLRVSWREMDLPVESAAGERPWISEELTLLEANIDDMTGEALGFLMERLFEAGALDVSFTPCTMKKSRPGVMVSVLVRGDRLDALRETFFCHSTTIGFRESAVNRLSLRREETTLSGPFGEAKEKTVFYGGEKLSSKIEFEDRARLAREKGISLSEAERIILRGDKEP